MFRATGAVLIQEEKIHAGGTAWRTPRGELRVWAAAPMVLVIQIEGFGEGQFASRILGEFEAMRTKGRAQLFFDMSRMPAYESELRVGLTNRFLAVREDIACIHAYTLSKLVAMGVAVAGLALGSLLRASRDRAEFDTALAAALRSSGSRLSVAEILVNEKTRPKAEVS